jgi:hypothetical protein
MIRCRWPTPADQCYTTNTKKGFVSFEVQSFLLPFNLQANMIILSKLRHFCQALSIINIVDGSSNNAG